jgi:hypothetical protein
VTVNGFKKCCTSSASNAVDVTDMLWKGSEEEGNIRNGCEEGEWNDCEDGDSDPDW